MYPLKHSWEVKGRTVDVDIRYWRHGDPFPPLAPSISQDNETELISVRQPVPPLVVAGFFNPDDMTCWYVGPEDIQEWHQHCYDKRILIYMFNAAFDVPTSENKVIYRMLDEDLVLDVGINMQIKNIATRGDIAFDAMGLKGAAKKYLSMELDKGEEKGDEAARVTFHRGVPITEEQARYLSGDVVSTYYLGREAMPQPTAFLQTRADFVLASMTRNGLLVDRKVHKALTNMFNHRLDVAREKLKTFGFPVKDTEPKETFSEQLAKLIPDSADWKKNQMRRCLVGIHNGIQKARDNSPIAPQYDILGIVFKAVQSANSSKNTPMRKPELAVLNPLLEKLGAVPFDASRLAEAWPCLMLTVINAVNADPDNWEAKVLDELDNHIEVVEPVAKVGPQKFLQEYVERLLEQNPQLQLETTKTGLVKVTKTDTWRLDDAGITSEFLSAYVDYKHNEKMLSTYLNPAFIKEDGKIHPHYNVMVRTGRTSSGGYGSINAQNLPSRDKTAPLRNMVTAPPGWVLLQSDFSSIELAGLAQMNYTRYGFSRMRDIINAGVCPHYFYAGVFMGLIKPEELKLDHGYVEELTAMLKSEVPKDKRALAKVVNFG